MTTTAVHVLHFSLSASLQNIIILKPRNQGSKQCCAICMEGVALHTSALRLPSLVPL